MNGLLSRVFCLVCLLVLVCSVVCSSSLEVWAAESEIAPIANPTETTETLTRDEMIALLAGSKVTYRYQLWGDDVNDYRTGTGVISVLSPINLTNYAWSSILYVAFPIDFQGRELYSFDCTFDLPITVKSCVAFKTCVSPSAYSSKSSSAYGALCYDLNMEYQLFSGSQVLITRNFYAPENGVFNYKMSFNALSNGMFGSFSYGNLADYGPYFAIGTEDKPNANTLSYVPLTLNGLSQDVSRFGFSWKAYSQLQTGSDNDTFGLGFWIYDFSFTYLTGGGYDPNGGGGETGGGETDPGGGGSGSGGDYGEKLDKLYDELVKQGQIQQSQNAAIIQGQNDIKEGQKDILEAQKDQTEQDKQLWEDTFDPSEEDVGSLGDDIFSEDTQNELKEKLGLFTFLDDTFEQLLDVFDDSGGSTSLRFPGLQVTIDGTTYQVIEPYDFDIAETLDKFDFLIAATRFVNGIIIVFAFLSYLHHLKVRFFGDD